MKLDGKSIQAAIAQLVEDYKFDPYKILEIVKLWIKSGFKKDFAEHRKSNIVVNIEQDWAVTIYQELEVVENVEDENCEISMKDAKKDMPDVTIWDKLLIDVTPSSLELSRIAAQAAWQTIMQNLKTLEREKFFEKFQNKEWELLKAKVLRSHWESVVLEAEWTAVVLQPEWQIPHRFYEPNEEVFVLLKQISKWKWWIVLEISQSSPDYIEAILKKIVPELEEWTVKIDKIARIAGIKTKIVISSEDESIDPVWVMVWRKWDRINTVLSLLDWEKIDYIEANDDPSILIQQSLKPAKINKIEIVDDKKAIAYVDSDQKPLAIWKWASNVKLASRITGYNIEIQ